MKTLAEFKKALVIGKKLHTIHHLTYAGRGENNEPLYTDKDLGVREISIVQSNSFALKTQRSEPMYKHDEYGNRVQTGEYTQKIVDSWCQYPKASECVFNPDESLTILEEQRDKSKVPVLTYKFVE